MSDAAQQAADTYPTPRHGWTCFHCGAHFSSSAAGEQAAREHFGPDPGWQPACLDWFKSAPRDLLDRARRAEFEARRANERAHEAEEDADGARSEISGFVARFKGVQSLQEVFFHYDSMEGRALAAEAIVRAAERLAPDVVRRARDIACLAPGDEPAKQPPDSSRRLSAHGFPFAEDSPRGGIER